jgi:hypothetical protein
MTDLESFDPTPPGNRRSVFFSIAIVTAFISYTAATSAYVSSPSNLWMSVFLTALGTIALLFGVLVTYEPLPWLTE